MNKHVITPATAALLAWGFGGLGIAAAQTQPTPGIEVRAPSGVQPVQAVPGPDVARTNERIDRLEIALRDLQAIIYSVEEGTPRPQFAAPAAQPSGGGTGVQEVVIGDIPAADLSVRLSAIEGAMAQLTGQVETLAFKLDQLERKLPGPGLSGDGLSADGQMMLPVDPAAAGPNAADPSSPVATGAPMDMMAPAAPAPVALPDDPAAAFQIGYNAVLGAEFEEAQAALEAFVTKFPNAQQTPEAKFLLGEVYLATQANNSAAKIFLEHVDQYPDDPRAAEAYLKLGTALTRLNLKQQACDVLSEGQAKFPNASGDIKARYTAEQGAAGCS